MSSKKLARRSLTGTSRKPAVPLEPSTQSDSGYFANRRDEIGPLLPAVTDRVLEIGCGSGGTMSWLRRIRIVRHAIGMELVPAVADQARSAFDEVVCGDIETVPLPDGPFDLVLALDVLEHLADPWAMVARLKLVLRPGGTLLVSIPNVANAAVVLPLLLKGRWRYTDAGLLDRTHLRFFTRETAIELLTGAGLVLEREGRVLLAGNWMQRMPPHWRWYCHRLMGLVVPRRLLDFQFLLAARAP
jgi:SAM-dependent methyltransferase